MQASRPGVISFIGITSIILGAMGVIAGIAFGFMDIGMLMNAKASPAISTPLPVVPPALYATTGGTPERLPFYGLSYLQRQSFADGLQHVRPLSADQLLQLDELLAEQGKVVTGGGAVPPPDQFAAGVSKSGHRAIGDTPGLDYFVLGTGRLELASDRAVFFPTGGQPSIRSNAVMLWQLPSASTPLALQPDQIRSIVRSVDELNGAKIRSTQLKTLITLLQTPGEQLILPTSDGTDPAYELTSASTSPEGMLTINCLHGTVTSTLTCDATGGMVSTSSSSGATGATAISGSTADRSACIATLSLTLCQIPLAAFLLIIGIVTLRSSPRGRLLHRIYIALKLPVGIATAGVSFWMWTSLIRSGMATTGPGATSAGAAACGSAFAGALFGIVPAAAGCVWPIVLIFVLMSRNARTFYASGQSEPAYTYR